MRFNSEGAHIGNKVRRNICLESLEERKVNTDETAKGTLKNARRGVLAVIGDMEYPYSSSTTYTMKKIIRYTFMEQEVT